MFRGFLGRLSFILNGNCSRLLGKISKICSNFLRFFGKNFLIFRKKFHGSQNVGKFFMTFVQICQINQNVGNFFHNLWKTFEDCCKFSKILAIF